MSGTLVCSKTLTREGLNPRFEGLMLCEHSVNHVASLHVSHNSILVADVVAVAEQILKT